LAGEASSESQHFFLAEGRCRGRIQGRFSGVNHPRRRGDGAYLPDFQGVIETEDGAVIFFDHHGYGRTYPPGLRQIVISGTHVSDHENYRWLNDSVAVGEGEVRALEEGGVVLVIEWYEAVWEPVG
jgi:hypothetical protein